MNTGNAAISGDTIILGFTGSIGSGCTYIGKAIEEHYGYSYFSLSDILREEAKKQGIGHASADLQDLGNELRRQHGTSYLVVRLLEKVGSLDGATGIIIDSIRNDGEVNTLKQFPNFYLFSVHADFDCRKKRALGLKDKFHTPDEFDNADSRDQAENIQYGQQVKKCNYLSDIIINNAKNIVGTAKKQKRDFIEEIYSKYIAVIEARKKGLLIPERLPSINETLMTMAYAESQRSSCLKRKVGALIAFIQEKDLPEHAINEIVHVLSTGHNEVPIGTIPCIFSPSHEGCYRDHLQEEQAKKIKHCPECGQKIKLPKIRCKAVNCDFETTKFVKFCHNCKKEIEIKYVCSKCKTNIFPDYLISGGKLLDMCKALHAEENALLNLGKISSQGSDNLVLFTTTYPCTLCANKIAVSGINKVVFADPYPMPTAQDILRAAGVETEKFEGIKSSAYFRLYNSL